MQIGVRLSDDHAAALEAAAASSGMTRSAWIARLIERERALIDRQAKRSGLTRNQWIIKIIRGGIWDRRGKLRLAPQTREELRKAIVAVNRIGQNVNAAAHAMTIAAQSGGAMSIIPATDKMLGMADEIRRVVADHHTAIMGPIAAEIAYWSGLVVKLDRGLERQ
jgi:hypothetical protein